MSPSRPSRGGCSQNRDARTAGQSLPTGAPMPRVQIPPRIAFVRGKRQPDANRPARARVGVIPSTQSPISGSRDSPGSGPSVRQCRRFSAAAESNRRLSWMRAGYQSSGRIRIRTKKPTGRKPDGRTLAYSLFSLQVQTATLSEVFQKPIRKASRPMRTRFFRLFRW